MIKKLGVNNIIIGHSENRAAGDNEKIIKEKFLAATKNKFNIVLCIGENKSEKKRKLTLSVLKKQIKNALHKKLVMRVVKMVELIRTACAGEAIKGSRSRFEYKVYLR